MNRKRAYDLAIEAIGMAQRQYWAGHMEYLAHGDSFEFAVRDHKQWQKWEKAKNRMIEERDHRQIGMEL